MRTCGVCSLPLRPEVEQGMALVLQRVGVSNPYLVDPFFTEVQFSGQLYVKTHFI